jgi:hypothetical protein
MRTSSRIGPRMPDEVRGDVYRMQELLRRVVRRSHLSPSQIEQALNVSEGFLELLFAGRIELQVAHVFRILRLIGMIPGQFFLALVEPEDRPAGHVTAERRRRSEPV